MNISTRVSCRYAALGLTCMLSAVATPAMSDEVTASSSGAWQYEVTPYLWAAGLDGNIRINNRPSAGLGVEQSFSDILKILDFGLMGAFEARKDRWALLLDGVYFRVADEGSISGPLGFVSLTGKGKITQQLYSIAGAYRVSEGSDTVDVIGGLRYNSVKWDVDISTSVPATTPNFKQTKSWVDPYIGARVQHSLDKRWTLMGYADIGGFGAGSDLSWQTIVGANYAFKPDMIGKFGYRYVSNDYDKNDFTYDIASAGVYLGLGIRW